MSDRLADLLADADRRHEQQREQARFDRKVEGLFYQLFPDAPRLPYKAPPPTR